MNAVMKATTWESRDTVSLARGLLGKFLVCEVAEGRREAMITEVEVYDGEADKACHARNGRTPRNGVMYEHGGVWYVYLCYGMHELLNLVTGPEDYPAAVLIRGVDDIRGPGRVTKHMGITRRFNGLDASQQGGLWVEDRGIVVPDHTIKAGPRVGVDYAGPKWAAMPWRFWIEGVRGRRRAWTQAKGFDDGAIQETYAPEKLSSMIPIRRSRNQSGNPE
jgi:DNA-3-methyladenine glycosylase